MNRVGWEVARGEPLSWTNNCQWLTHMLEQKLFSEKVTFSSALHYLSDEQGWLGSGKRGAVVLDNVNITHITEVSWMQTMRMIMMIMMLIKMMIMLMIMVALTQEEEKEAEREREAREMKEQSCKKQKTAQTYFWTIKTLRANLDNLRDFLGRLWIT